MSKMIQIRHVPDRLHRRLKARAAAAGMSLSDFLRQELQRVGDQLSAEELRERLALLDPVTGGGSSVRAVRAERNS